MTTEANGNTGNPVSDGISQGTLEAAPTAAPLGIPTIEDDDMDSEPAWKGRPARGGIPISLGFKLLILVISTVLFVLVAVALFAFFADSSLIKGEDTQLNSEFIMDLVVYGSLILLIVLLVSAFFMLYIAFLLFSPKQADSLYCRAYRKVGNVAGFVLFVLMAICVAIVVRHYVYFPKVLTATYLFAALLAYLPIAITWRVNDEERLKNFIDGFSKACSTMAFMGGAIAVIVKAFL